MNNKLQKIIAIIAGLISGKFYGKLTLTFTNGDIVFLKKEETTRMS